MKTKYRADIDGLRAIAVLAVVFNHAGLTGFSGGYIGVDVFFVISGYLITAIIAREIEQGEFSILRFYERRIRRIFPALFTVLAAASLLSIWLYNSNDLLEFGKSLLATTLFYSNFLFWSQSGYFDAPSLLKPLLHTWSLAVEEQFYIFYPWVLFLSYRYARPHTRKILILLGVLSLALNIYTVHGLEDSASTAFYLLHTRTWELLLGGLIALGVFPNNAQNFTRNLAAFAGLALIGIPIFYYTNSTPFPGVYAIPPALGSALLIWAGANTPTPPAINKLISIRPMVFIGWVSYSLYLWHWLLFIFAKYIYIKNLNLTDTLIVLALIFAISTLSWRLVEQPFRSQQRISRKAVFRFAGAAMFAFSAFGAVIQSSGGFAGFARFQTLDQTLTVPEACDLKRRTADEITARDLCPLGERNSAPTFLLWGDSHARASGHGVDISAQKAGISGAIAFTNGCPPFIVDEAKTKCQITNKLILAHLAAHPEIELVILDARWRMYTKNRPAELESGLAATLENLSQLNRRIAIMLPTPEMQYEIPSTYFIAQRRGLDINQFAGENPRDYLAESKLFLNLTEGLSQTYELTFLDPRPLLCEKDICPAVMAGNILYVDRNHISSFAAERLTPLYDALFEGSAP